MFYKKCSRDFNDGKWVVLAQDVGKKYKCGREYRAIHSNAAREKQWADWDRIREFSSRDAANRFALKMNEQNGF